MQIKVEHINGANASVEASISPAALQKKEDKMIASAASNMKVDGFRKGKVPSHIVKARFGKQMKDDAKNEALREVYDKALVELNIKAESVVGEPSISKFEENEDGSIDLAMQISMRPVVNVEGYEAFIPEYKTPKVTKKEVAERLEKMMKLIAGLKTISKNRPVEKDDFVVINFEGFLNGTPFEGGKAEGHTLEIGSGSFIPGFEDGIIGMEVGEEKDVMVTFPENYGNKELAGQPTVFKITVTEIKVKDVKKTPDEDALKKFLPGVENATVEILEEQLENELKSEKLSKLFNDEVKPKFIDTILEKLALDLPQSIVEQEIDLQMRGVFSKLESDEIKAYASDPEKIKAKREEFRSDCERSVKLTFIVDELAKKENIVVTDQDVLQVIYYEAMQQGANPKEYLEYYEKQGVLPAVKMSLIEERLFAQLFTKGK